MKKLMNYGALFLLGGAFLTSCGKTTKGKLSGEWRLDSWTMETTTNNDGDVTSELREISGGTITVTETDEDNEQTVSNGTVNTSSWTITKEGTWNRDLSYTITTVEEDEQTFGQLTSVTTTTTVTTTTINSSGSWNFLGGVEDDYKKNERVSFMTLSEVKTTEMETTSETVTTDGNGNSTTTTNDIPDSESTTETEYANGENAEIFLVVENKRKELQLTLEKNEDESFTSGNFTSNNSQTVNTSITMSQE